MEKSYSFADQIRINYNTDVEQLEGETIEEIIIRHDDVRRLIVEKMEEIASEIGQVINIEVTTEEIYDEDEGELIYKNGQEKCYSAEE